MPYKRIGAVDRLDLDQRLAAAGGARHRAQRCRVGHFAVARQQRALLCIGLAMKQRERHIAAENGAALARKSAGKAFRKRADTGDRHHAEPDAENQHIKAAQAAAQFAHGKAQRQ